MHWDEDDCTRCMNKAPRGYYIRLLQSCIGERDRGTCAFVTRMHSVIDLLMRRLEELEMPKERLEVLHHLCCALSKRPWQRYLFVGRDLKQWDPLQTAIIVAMVAQYDGATDLMLEGLPVSSLDTKAWDFGTPLDMAIVTGNTVHAEKLLGHGATLDLDQYKSTCWSLVCAAKEGYSQVIRRMFRDVPPDCWDHGTLSNMARVAERAAANCRWDVVSHLLHHLHGTRWKRHGEPHYFPSIICQAAKYGQVGLVEDLLAVELEHTQGDRPFWSGWGRRYPLREAAGGGQLDICNMLFEKGIRPQTTTDVAPEAQMLARYVARGGSVAVYRLLKPRKFWTPAHEIHFLPIAADYGHLEFARFAIENACDQHPKQRSRAPAVVLEQRRAIRYPDDIRYFALCRAIASGHLHIVHWLIEDVGVDVAKLAFSPLFPMDIAAAADNKEVVELLLNLGVSPASTNTSEEVLQCKMEVVKTLDTYREALCLQKDYTARWYRSTPWGRCD
ncbi:ankyrin [Ophiobolus disseminans]|uniref:Ankyrin n=1 Tax=Ophiobolus disseminans TaxID=1469910 RepID=A0A6A7AC25_9PLEO|nr:ankyrin [Ophiobolus disseminans]